MARMHACEREPDVLDALARDWWPNRADDDLRAHVAGCASCTDLVVVAGALQKELAVATDARRLPPADIVWWRAQLRARDEAARRATRPIAVAHGVAIAVSTVVAWEASRAVAGWAWEARGLLAEWAGLCGASLASFGAGVLARASSGSALWILLIATALVAVALTPVAVYFAVNEK